MDLPQKLVHSTILVYEHLRPRSLVTGDGWRVRDSNSHFGFLVFGFSV